MARTGEERCTIVWVERFGRYFSGFLFLGDPSLRLKSGFGAGMTPIQTVPDFQLTDPEIRGGI